MQMGSKAKERDEAYFQKLIDEMPEPIYNGIDGDSALKAEREKTGDPNARAAVNVSDSVDSALDIFHLEAEPTERLMKFCEQQHISLASLLLMGLRTYYQKMNGNDDVSINTAIARRATLKRKKIRRNPGFILSHSERSLHRIRHSCRDSLKYVICRMNIFAMPIMTR